MLQYLLIIFSILCKCKKFSNLNKINYFYICIRIGKVNKNWSKKLNISTGQLQYQAKRDCWNISVRWIIDKIHFACDIHAFRCTVRRWENIFPFEIIKKKVPGCVIGAKFDISPIFVNKIKIPIHRLSQLFVRIIKSTTESHAYMYRSVNFRALNGWKNKYIIQASSD